MKIIKRDGTIVEYNPEKIKNAIKKANNDVGRKERMIAYCAEPLMTKKQRFGVFLTTNREFRSTPFP